MGRGNKDLTTNVIRGDCVLTWGWSKKIGMGPQEASYVLKQGWHECGGEFWRLGVNSRREDGSPIHEFKGREEGGFLCYTSELE